MESNMIDELDWRGLVQQTTSAELSDHLQDPRVIYVGFDPTADSLHVGSFVPLMTLRRFQQAGHTPVALVGGATGMIGDPSGKSEERKLLSEDLLRSNVKGIEKQLRRFLDFDGPNAAILVNNYDWMKEFSFLEFLRDIGKHSPMGVMMAKDSVRSRLERAEIGLSYTEFSYMLLQAFDFVHLARTCDCSVQLGGSDQWGNITAGIELARRLDGKSLFGITGPLLTKSDGSKMGKTERGAIWLDAEKTSPYAFYQYWVNVADEDVSHCLRYLTDLDRNSVQELDRARIEAAHERVSQRTLAEVLTRMVHGDAGLASAQRATEIFFGAEIRDLDDRQLKEIFADVPSCELSKCRLSDSGMSLVEALVEAELATSKGEARRTIEQGGAYVNNCRRTDLETMLIQDDLASESMLVLRKGKKKYALLRFEA